MIALLALTAGAQATICADRLSPPELTLALGLSIDALADGQSQQVYERLSPIVDRVPCLTEVVDAELLAELMRVISQVHHELGNADAATWWATGSKASAELGWSYIYGDDHPFRVMYSAARPARPIRLDDAGLLVPPGGALFVNGRMVQLPEAPDEGPVLVQVFDHKQQLVDAWWQSGAAFPSMVLSGRARVVQKPLWWKGDGPTSARYRPLDDPAIPIGPLSWSPRR